MKRHKVLENDQYTVWVNAKTISTYTQLSFDIERPNKKGNTEVKHNAFELYLLPNQLREFAAFLQTL
jgi:hypothetical protein